MATQPTAGRRHGVTLAMLLCVMTIVAFVTAGILSLMAADRHLLKREQAREQANWLAATALQRGAARVLAAEDYRGETWIVDAEELSGQDNGHVMIRVEPQPGQEGRYLVSADAEFPRGATLAVHARRSMLVHQAAAKP